MALRYSGEVEIRLTYDARSRSYRGFVQGPRIRSAVEEHLAPRGDPRTSECYDAAARFVIERLERRFGRTLGAAHGSDGRALVTREFEAPCPPGTIASGDCRCQHDRRRRPTGRRRRRRAR